ncbi:hypothetical protein MMC13_005115 [Lambiella insularis]|nr:hypothetical protein [Lambiella insularis]
MATVMSHHHLHGHWPFPQWTNASISDQQNATPRTLLATHNSHRTISPSSALSTGSVIVQPLRVRNENAIPSRSNSGLSLDFNEASLKLPVPRHESARVSHKSSWGTDIPLPPPAGAASIHELASDTLEDVNLDTDRSTSPVTGNALSNRCSGSHTGPRLSFAQDKDNLTAHSLPQRQLSIKSIGEIKSHPFRRWMSTLHRKSLHRHRTLQSREQRWTLDDFDETSTNHTILLQSPAGRGHKKSSSWASSGFVTAVKSASVSLATLSVAPHSRKAHRSSLLRAGNRSSWLSQSFNRPSIDGSSLSVQVIDEASRDRAHKRRMVLEEIVDSEESYVADLKVLVNVYFTLLATSIPSSHRKLTHIHENITEILVLHEDLLGRLRQVIQACRNKDTLDGDSTLQEPTRHTRRHSVNTPMVAPNANAHFDVRRSLDVQKYKRSQDASLVSDPKEAATIAALFEQVMAQFFIYEEYGAKYEIMLCDMTLTSQSIPNWHAYERGLEALASTLAPVNVREGCNRKGLTFGDLLIKARTPNTTFVMNQSIDLRVTRYPLLFAELFKNLHVVDCPESRVEVEKVLFRLREIAAQIDKATNDEYARERIQRSWQLQDLLVFADTAAAAFTIRSLGHATLCGVLHVTYSTKHGISGQYMLCALFNSCLIMAAPSHAGRSYAIMASISLADLRIEGADNGKGLQCHTALYSWKIIFESEQQLFEVILSACSAQEEQRWKLELSLFSARESQDTFEKPPLSHANFSLLMLELKSIGSILGQPGTLARRISVQRAQTLGPRTNVSQVFIRNTHALKDSIDSSTASNLTLVSRSHSLLSSHRNQVLAPKRADRIRMEHDLANVWTKELLPYPGMGSNRVEHPIRASANSLMRKFSKSSIASGFSKRSASLGSLTNSKVGDTQQSIRDFGPFNYGNDIPVNPGEAQGSLIHTSRPLEKIDSVGRTSLTYMTPPRRTSSKFKMTPQSSSGRKRKLRMGSHDQTDVSHGGGEKTLRTRWSSPISLIRSLSTEKMKSIFS